MSTATATATSTFSRHDVRREHRFGIFGVVLAIFTVAVFAPGRGGETATFDLNLGRDPLFLLPDVALPVGITIVVLSLVMAAIAAHQYVRGFGDRAVLALGVVVGLFVLAFLTWAAAGGELNLTTLLRGTIRGAVPLTFGALAGVMCERSGVINIAIEAQLLFAAFFAALGSTVASNPWVGLLAGILIGAFVGWVLAVLSIKFHADQIIAGVVLVVFATGLTAFLLSELLTPRGWNSPVRFSPVEIPVLSKLPIIGPLIFGQSVIVYAMFITVAVVQWLMFSTRYGLRVRSVGEKPKAADTVGIHVERIRYSAVILGGAIAGIGGAYFTLDSAAQFSREMSAGRGFIALAAMLVGRYNPVGAFGAALIFGFADSLATSLSIAGVGIPSDFLLMAPYLATIAVVAGVVGKLRMPAADGQPYTKE